MLISLFGQSTRLKAPVLTYVREIWQYDTYQKDYINFCAQRRTMLPMSCIWIRPTIW